MSLSCMSSCMFYDYHWFVLASADRAISLNSVSFPIVLHLVWRCFYYLFKIMGKL